MKVEILDHLPSELDDFALEDANASFYQTSTWVGSLSSVLPHMSAFYLFTRESGDDVGYLPFMKIRRGPFETLWSMPYGT